MTSNQESKLSMYLAVKDYLTANAAIVTPLPNYSATMTTFQSVITSLQAYSEQQQFDKTGLAANKKQLKQTLVTLAGDASRKLTAYARFTNNLVLLKEVRFTDSTLKRLPDTKLRDTTQGLYDRAQTNLTALASYGVTAATQTALQTAITAFVVAIPKPRLGINEKKQNTLLVAGYFKTADGALDNLDVIVDLVRLTQANFYSGYKGTRKIVNTGLGSLAVRGFVSDAASGDPLKGARLTFALNGNGTAAIAANRNGTLIKKSADKGGFNIKTLEAGIYTVTISKNGFKEQVLTMPVTLGEPVELDIKLSKS
ncbi:MAG: carboxypeptidase regulatory-like domain-containing protein [Chlorobiales bacterium]|nr:carboxypeptidase regulatory-like domain-containing protein [Chlorobiales bacterium]